MRALLSCTLAVALCCCASAEDKKDDKIDAKKLVGKWEPKQLKKAQSAVIEFHKDGKVTITLTADGKERRQEGTYRLDGDKLSVTINGEGGKDAGPVTVIRLTDTELVTKDETFTRLKGK